MLTAAVFEIDHGQPTRTVDLQCFVVVDMIVDDKGTLMLTTAVLAIDHGPLTRTVDLQLSLLST